MTAWTPDPEGDDAFFAVVRRIDAELARDRRRGSHRRRRMVPVGPVVAIVVVQLLVLLALGWGTL